MDGNAKNKWSPTRLHPTAARTIERIVHPPFQFRTKEHMRIRETDQKKIKLPVAAPW
jgi:hypothetical protein